MRLAALVALALAVAPAPARAHDRSVSYARAALRDDGAALSVRLSALDVNALAAAGLRDPATLAGHLTDSLVLGSAAGDCALRPGSFVELEAPVGWSRYEWRVDCGAPPSEVRAAPVPNRPSHVCFVRLRWEGRDAVHERVLSELEPASAVPPPDGAGEPGPAFVRWLPVGVEHILLGLDHLAFLAMLLVLARSLREAAGMVTGFTLGHSVTLAAAALDRVRPDAPTVEAVIGLSVALVAVENVWLVRERRDLVLPAVALGVPVLASVLTANAAFAGVALFAACHLALAARSERPAGWRWAVAAVFGLLHGFGFAGALREGGLPAGDATSALLGFNLGVELGQLAVVAVAWPLVRYAVRADTSRRLTVELASALGVAAGTFWFLSRALG